MFTIITPCYNSSETLMRTYNSLLKLDYEEFEWILVDDASPDQGKTRELILWISENAPFSVQFKFLEENHFCSKSVFEATRMARGEYACILDHDDELTKDSLRMVAELLAAYNVDGDLKIAGVIGRCLDENYKLIGPPFREDAFVANEGEVRFKFKVTSELFQFTKVEILNKIFSKMKPGYTNGFCWARISEQYSYVFSNSVLRVYDTWNPSSYSNDKSKHVMYPENKMEALLLTVNSYKSFSHYNLVYTARMLASARRHSFLCKKKRPDLLAPLPLYLRFIYFFSTLPAALKVMFK